MAEPGSEPSRLALDPKPLHRLSVFPVACVCRCVIYIDVCVLVSASAELEYKYV